MELSKAKINLIKSLKDKTARQDLGLFCCEGAKMAEEVLKSELQVEELFYTESFAASCGHLISIAQRAGVPLILVSDAQMQRISAFKTAGVVLCLVRMPSYEFCVNDILGSVSLVLDSIQDPGNLGTIIRLSDWFGIRNIFCSPDTVDLYNPKVVQATMGAITRTRLHYQPLVPILASAKEMGIEICGTFLDGSNIYAQSLPLSAMVVMGNEGRGISSEVASMVSRRLLIPSFGEQKGESLNVGIAAAITCSEFFRANAK